MGEDSVELDALQQALADSDAGWEAGPTPLTELSSEEQQLRLGYEPGPEDPNLEAQEQIAKANVAAMLSAPTTAGTPASFDWRNHNGKSYVTDVRDQGGCGSCVAFGTVASAESRYMVEWGKPEADIDYSEAHLFYCHARAEGRRCNNGWWPSKALDAFRDKGVVDEECYPYTAGDQDCSNLCSNWESRLTKIRGWKRISSISEIKDWIATRGPLVACYTVYGDFYSYTGGIYRHVQGNARGGHCVSCVGYNDAQGYWICKNSWGSNWGENGYFRIAYGECGIDSSMDAIEGVREDQWVRRTKVQALWTISQERNAWAYIQGIGWRRISPDNDAIFTVMLADLAAAKAAGRPVNVKLVERVIKQVYVL